MKLKHIFMTSALALSISVLPSDIEVKAEEESNQTEGTVDNKLSRSAQTVYLENLKKFESFPMYYTGETETDTNENGTRILLAAYFGNKQYDETAGDIYNGTPMFRGAPEKKKEKITYRYYLENTAHGHFEEGIINNPALMSFDFYIHTNKGYMAPGQTARVTFFDDYGNYVEREIEVGRHVYLTRPGTQYTHVLIEGSSTIDWTGYSETDLVLEVAVGGRPIKVNNAIYREKGNGVPIEQPIDVSLNVPSLDFGEFALGETPPIQYAPDMLRVSTEYSSSGWKLTARDLFYDPRDPSVYAGTSTSQMRQINGSHQVIANGSSDDMEHTEGVYFGLNVPEVISTPYVNKHLEWVAGPAIAE